MVKLTPRYSVESNLVTMARPHRQRAAKFNFRRSDSSFDIFNENNAENLKQKAKKQFNDY